VVSDVPVDDEAPLVTSGILELAGAQSFGGAHRGRVVCVRVFIGVMCTRARPYGRAGRCGFGGRGVTGSNHGARTFSWIFQDLPALCVKW
jgi:hypothetical protein